MKAGVGWLCLDGAAYEIRCPLRTVFLQCNDAQQIEGIRMARLQVKYLFINGFRNTQSPCLVFCPALLDEVVNHPVCPRFSASLAGCHLVLWSGAD